MQSSRKRGSDMRLIEQVAQRGENSTFAKSFLELFHHPERSRIIGMVGEQIF